MIYSLKFVDFQDLAECRSLTFQSKETFLPINYEFKSGVVYGLASDFGCGSWGLSTCIGGRLSQDYRGNILLNSSIINGEELSKYACFVTENMFEDLNIPNESLTPRKCVEKALLISNQPYSVNQIKSFFCLSEERFDRQLAQVSGEIWLISLAINFALGKQIFCYPWLNAIDISKFEIACRHGIIHLLKSTGKIVIVPSSQKNLLRKYCDHVIYFDKNKIIYR